MITLGRHTSPRTRRTSPNRRGHSSCSRSSAPCPHRRSRSRSRSPRSLSSSWDRRSRPFAAEQQHLHLRDQPPVPSRVQDQDADFQASSSDNVMSADTVHKLFADLVCLPVLSHYADPFPDAPVTSTQLVPHAKDSAKSTIVSEADELNTFGGLFQNYTFFHSLSGEQDKEARTSAYHELMNLMLSQKINNLSMFPLLVQNPRDPFIATLKENQNLRKSMISCICNGLLSKRPNVSLTELRAFTNTALSPRLVVRLLSGLLLQ